MVQKDARRRQVGGGVQLHSRSTTANEKLLDQEAVVEDDVHY
jgi:hypothetical protein